ncbi:MAG: nucleotide exchange factor GrpE [Phycisphaerae bacterium]
MSPRKKKAEPHADATPPTKLEEPLEDVAETGIEVPEAAADQVQAAEAQPPPTPEQEIEAVRDENLRLMAELRNVRQRAQREQQEALKYAEADFAKELLLVLDDLERTQESVKTADDVQPVAEGVRIVYEHFLKVLRGREIEPIEALGKPFDPDLHEAVMQQPSAEHPAGTITQEIARGYKMHGRVIRPAKVIVSSAPPAPPADEETEANTREE